MESIWKRVSGVLGSSSNSGNDDLTKSQKEQVSRLVGMGFEESPAIFAIKNTRDVNEAVQFLLSGRQNAENATGASAAAASSSSSSSSTTRATTPIDVEAELRRDRMAKAAMERQQQNHIRRFPAKSKNKTKTQQQTTGSKTTFEERLEVATARLANYPQAVDTLVYVLSTIIKNPDVQKYREIKMTNKRFKETIGNSRGQGETFLKLIGFQQSGDWYVLRGKEVVQLVLAQTSLVNAQNHSPQYQTAKESQAFQKALSESVASATQEEMSRRQAFVSKVPVEPELGIAGTTRVTVFCGDAVLQRRFRSDDVLQDIIHWLGATHSSLIPKQLFNGSWELVNKTFYPMKTMDVADDNDVSNDDNPIDSSIHSLKKKKVRNQTLQALDLWPSAELIVQSAGTLEAQKKLLEADANA